MKRLLLVYQIGVACSDTFTGAALMIAPELTLRAMGISIDSTANVFIGYLGAFVLGVGLVCAYGAAILLRTGNRTRMEMVWFTTAILRGAVAAYVALQVFSAQLAPPWLLVAAFDAGCAALQGIGLSQGWLSHATR